MSCMTGCFHTTGLGTQILDHAEVLLQCCVFYIVWYHGALSPFNFKVYAEKH